MHENEGIHLDYKVKIVPSNDKAVNKKFKINWKILWKFK